MPYPIISERRFGWLRSGVIILGAKQCKLKEDFRHISTTDGENWIHAVRLACSYAYLPTVGHQRHPLGVQVVVTVIGLHHRQMVRIPGPPRWRRAAGP